MPNRSEAAWGRPAGAHHDPHADGRQSHNVVRQLHERKIKLRAKPLGVVRIEAPLLYVRNDADNFSLYISLANFQDQTLADGIFVAEILARRDVVDHDHRRRMFVVLGGEETAAA